MQSSQHQVVKSSGSSSSSVQTAWLCPWLTGEGEKCTEGTRVSGSHSGTLSPPLSTARKRTGFSELHKKKKKKNDRCLSQCERLGCVREQAMGTLCDVVGVPRVTEILP